VLDAACFSFRSDDTTPGSSPSNNNNSGNIDQASAPASKKRRLGTSPIWYTVHIYNSALLSACSFDYHLIPKAHQSSG
jgi:hypothetical protein